MEFLQPSSFRGIPVVASRNVCYFPRLASDVFVNCLLSKKTCSPCDHGEHQGLTLIAAFFPRKSVQTHPLTTWCGNSSHLHLNEGHSIVVESTCTQLSEALPLFIWQEFKGLLCNY